LLSPAAAATAGEQRGLRRGGAVPRAAQRQPAPLRRPERRRAGAADALLVPAAGGAPPSGDAAFACMPEPCPPARAQLGEQGPLSLTRACRAPQGPGPLVLPRHHRCRHRRRGGRRRPAAHAEPVVLPAADRRGVRRARRALRGARAPQRVRLRAAGRRGARRARRRRGVRPRSSGTAKERAASVSSVPGKLSSSAARCRSGEEES